METHDDLTIAAFTGCGMGRLRALLDSLVLATGTPGPFTRLTWLEGLAERGPLATPASAASFCAGRTVVLLCRDPREALIENYPLCRADRRSPSLSLDDLLCARPAGLGPATPESRFGLRTCIDFMTAFIRAQETFTRFLVAHAEDLDADPWPEVRRIAAFLGLDATDAHLEAAARRTGPLARLTAPSTLHPTRVGPFALSAGQRAFADDVLAERLHPALARYRASRRTPRLRAAA